MKICFATEANYLNYTKRVKNYNIDRFLRLGLKNIPFYISTNLKSEFSEFDNHELIKIFDIEDLRRNNLNSKKYELLPKDPTGLYPALYPWNLRRFIIRKAAEDGFDAVFFLECDTKVSEHIDINKLESCLQSLYEPDTVKTSSARFVYKTRHYGQELFHLHEEYMKELNLNFHDDQLDTLDGTNQLFFGENSNSLLKFLDTWDFISDFGYIRQRGYKTGYLSNLSFVIPMSGYRLIHTETPFVTDHVFEDRY